MKRGLTLRGCDIKCIFYASTYPKGSYPEKKLRGVKRREGKIYNNLKAGADRFGDTIDMIPTGDFDGVIDDIDLAIVFGCKGSSREIGEAYQRRSKQIVYIDKPHFRPLGLGEKGKDEHLRVSVDNFYPHQYFQCGRPPDRFESWGVKLRPWRNNDRKGKHVLIAGSSQKFHDFHDIGNCHEYYYNLSRKVRAGFVVDGEGEVVYRAKPSFAVNHPEQAPLIPRTRFSNPRTKIYKELENCWALVTWGSNAAIDALVYGVPVLVTGKGIARAMGPVKRSDLQVAIHEPWHPSIEERYQWFSDLAYCQFTPREMQNGLAWQHIIEQTPKSLFENRRYREADEGQQLVMQYQHLHERGNHFKGNSIVGHQDVMKALVNKFEPDSLLDYGCGKGEQYTIKEIHKQWGVKKIMPRMYDPGVRDLSAKPGPSETYDGVICCDVMEHIPEQDVDCVINEVCGYARKFVFFAIHLDPARKLLPDGRNAHVTLRSRKWWEGKIKRIAPSHLYVVVKAMQDTKEK